MLKYVERYQAFYETSLFGASNLLLGFDLAKHHPHTPEINIESSRRDWQNKHAK